MVDVNDNGGNDAGSVTVLQESLDSVSRQNQEKATAKTKTNLSHNRANFRIEKQKRKRKARSSMRIPKVR